MLHRFVKDSRYLLQETADSVDAYGRITKLTDARGKVTRYEYGGNANNAFLTKITRAKDAAGAADLVTDLAYDSNGYLSSIKDEGGSFRRFSYDSFGRLYQVRNDSSVLVEQYTYQYSRTAEYGWAFQDGNPNLVTTTTYLQHSPSEKSVVTREYLDGLGRSIQTNVQDGTTYYVTATQYDLMGRPWRAWKPYPRTSSVYDASFATNATSWYNTYHSSSTAKPYTETLYTADAFSRVRRGVPEYIGTTASDSVKYAYGIDATARQTYTEVTDESGKKVRRYQDALGNEVKVVLGYGATEATTTTLAYDVLGQRKQATDPRGLVTTYARDTRGLLTSRVSPDAGTASHKYDRAGNLRYSQDANQAAAGQVHFTTYDFAGRPLTEGVGTATFSSLDPDATTQPTLETTQSNWRTVWTYDVKPTNVYPWSLFWTQISPLTLSNVAGRLAAVASYPFSARYAYHPNAAVSEAEFYSAGSPAAAKRYAYTFGTGSYDALNRLKSADYSYWSGSAWTGTLAHDLAGITYDAAGNLKTLQRYRETGTLVDNLTYSYPAGSNRLSSVSDAVGASAESWDAEAGSFTYDAQGNLKTAPAPYSLTAATYDHRNLPLSLTRSGTTTAYRCARAGRSRPPPEGGSLYHPAASPLREHLDRSCHI